MPRCVAFLRGINLGKRRLQMSRLQALFQELGFAEVETFIASGNVIFSTAAKSLARVEEKIAQHLEANLGYKVDTFVRTAGEVIAVGQGKPFPEEGQEGITVNVSFLHEALPAETAKRLAALRSDYDGFRVEGREFYWLCRGRMSDSEIWATPAAKAIKLPTSTMRNMTSIRKLIAKHLS